MVAQYLSWLMKNIIKVQSNIWYILFSIRSCDIKQQVKSINCQSLFQWWENVKDITETTFGVCKTNYFRLESIVYPHPLEIKHIWHYINKVGLYSDNAIYIILRMYVYHSYVDHLTIDGSTSYFAKALTQRVNSQWTFNLHAAEFA